MSSLFLRIVLIVLLVLALFVLLVRAYLEFTFAKSQQKQKPSIVHERNISHPSENNTTERNKTSVSTAKMQKLFSEKNTTLEKKYKSVASEIIDYVHAQKVKKAKEQNKTKQVTKPFVSKCYTPPGKIELPKTVTPIKKTKEIQKKKKVRSHKPRLVIIMDDVDLLLEAEMIKKVPFSITPSIFPVTEEHPYTQEIADMFDVYMVHTPMEAYHFGSPEEDTLTTDETLEEIDAKIRRIKEDFPKLVAINNHTGSKFTSDAEAMDKLFCVLDKYGIHFVDSRTSADTKARQIAKLHGDILYERNVFLDNEDSVPAILRQLKEAVRYAKKHKLAIAICHPKPQTFRALMKAKKILHGVQVVTIDELY